MTAQPEREPENVTLHEMTREEARALFDREARRWLNMSGDAFLCAWDTGAFAGDVERADVMNVVMVLPLVR